MVDELAGYQPSAAVDAIVREPERPQAEVLAAIMEAYSDRPALGERADTAAGRDGSGPVATFATVTYGELWARVRAVAADWAGGTAPIENGDRVAVLGFTGIDQTVLELACIHTGTVSVPLQLSATSAQLREIVDETRPRVLAASVERLPDAVDLALASGDVRRLVVVDHHPRVDHDPEAVRAARARLDEVGRPVAVELLSTVVERGSGLPPAPLFVPPPGTDPLALLVYTSGSTGTPKGAMYPQRLASTMWTPYGFDHPELPSICVHYLPMSHLAGRWALMSTLARGGCGHFTARSDLSTLLDDIASVRPTELILVPRICDMLFQRFQSELDRNPDEAAVTAHLRSAFLGGRVVQALVGAAPVSDRMRAFTESVLGFPINETYGATENGRVLLNGRVRRPPVLDYRLEDVPEMGYFGTDLPYPRGELLVSSETIIPGYYRRPDLTGELLDAHGYHRTGDVMAEVEPDRLVWVDRRNSVLKLSQGEFVATSRLEPLFVTDRRIRQVFVYGNSERAHLLAVAVPTDDAVAEADGDTTALRTLLAESIHRAGRDAGLAPYEIPRDVLVETEPFSTRNGLLSDIGKPLHPRLVERYRDRLEQMYADQADRQVERLRELRTTGFRQPVLETVRGAAQALLGGSDAEVSPGARFSELGGDSLSALVFSTELREIFQVEVPVGVITGPATDLAALAAFIEAAASGPQRPTSAAVHGTGSTTLRATDLTLDTFVDTPTLDAATSLPLVEGPTRTVLLTGANGYLGRFLCLEWLERLAPVGGSLVCIVRGEDNDAARRRLEAAFDRGDDGLLARFRELAAQVLEVRAGDIGEPDLGLDLPTWRRLTTDVDRIVHAAAHVNHVLPYDQVFGSNVVGMAEVIRLAITGRITPVTYISTAAAAPPARRPGLDEDVDIRDLVPEYPLDDAYAGGYGASKWAGEVLLREAHDVCDLPVTTFRADMLLAHRKFSGQLNVPDQFTRLLFSLVTTGIAPGSFYEGDPRSAHYDGLPADFVAAAVTELGERATGGYRTFNVVNPHDDGVSLDTVVDWLVAAGHPIERIADHGAWFDRFESAVRALPATKRRHSVLPLLHAFRRPEPARGGPALPARRFRAAVRASGVGADDGIPHVSAQLITKYASDLYRLGLVAPPGGGTRERRSS